MSSQKYHVLFVDDEENNGIAFRSAFFRDYTISVARSGQEGLDILERQAVHLVVSDQRMPQMSGLEFLKIVKEQYPHAIRMVISGYSDVEIIMEAFNALGIFHFALKPWENRELKIVIDNALSKYRLQLENRELIALLQSANENLEEKVASRTFALEEKTRESIKLSEIKDKLFSIISHDLRSPLTSLTMLLTIFEDHYGGLTEDELLKYIGQIKNTLSEVDTMLSNLLAWSSAQMKEIEPAFNDLNLSPTLKKITEPYHIIANQKEITVTLAETLDPINVRIDYNMTAIILRNLLSNAIKFTPTSGNITIESLVYEQHAVIRVTDSGVGIAEDALHKLFSPNHLYTTKGTAKEHGTGLGLKLCEEFVSKQGGRIWVDSVAGKGTTFSFTLPLSSPAQVHASLID